MRKTLVAANWKMNGSLQANQTWCEGVLPALQTLDAEVLLCAPFVYLPQLVRAAQGTALMIGAENVSSERNGAFTGEISASMLFDIGVQWCIIGHSERRSLYGETDAMVAQKAQRLVEAGLQPVLCVGETLAQRENGETLSVVTQQLEAVLSVIAPSALGAIAYEPVWAIGTGLTATPDAAQAVHKALRDEVAKYDASTAQTLRILYGGSVKPNNAQALFAEHDIDGGLLGGASLTAEDFLAVCQSHV